MTITDLLNEILLALQALEPAVVDPWLNSGDGSQPAWAQFVTYWVSAYAIFYALIHFADKRLNTLLYTFIMCAFGLATQSVNGAMILFVIYAMTMIIHGINRFFFEISK